MPNGTFTCRDVAEDVYVTVTDKYDAARLEPIIIPACGSAIREIVCKSRGVPWDLKRTLSVANREYYLIARDRDDGPLDHHETCYVTYDGKPLDIVEGRDLVANLVRNSTQRSVIGQLPGWSSPYQANAPRAWYVDKKNDQDILRLIPCPTVSGLYIDIYSRFFPAPPREMDDTIKLPGDYRAAVVYKVRAMYYEDVKDYRLHKHYSDKFDAAIEDANSSLKERGPRPQRFHQPGYTHDDPAFSGSTYPY